MPVPAAAAQVYERVEQFGQQPPVCGLDRAGAEETGPEEQPAQKAAADQDAHAQFLWQSVDSSESQGDFGREGKGDGAKVRLGSVDS